MPSYEKKLRDYLKIEYLLLCVFLTLSTDEEIKTLQMKQTKRKTWIYKEELENHSFNKIDEGQAENARQSYLYRM